MKTHWHWVTFNENELSLGEAIAQRHSASARSGCYPYAPPDDLSRGSRAVSISSSLIVARPFSHSRYAQGCRTAQQGCRQERKNPNLWRL